MALAHRYLISLALVLPALTPVSAQTRPPEAPPPQFRVVSMSDVQALLFDVDKKQETLYAGIGAFSQLYPSPKSHELLFYKEEANTDPKLPPLKVPLARARLPAGNPGPFLILLDHTPNGTPLPLEAVVVDNSLEAYPSNTYRVFNFSKRRLAVSLAGQDFILTHGQTRLVPYPNTRKAWLKVAADEQSDGWLLVSSSPHVVGTDSRTTLFLVDIAPSELDPDPKGIIARRMRETIVTDDKGVQHVQ